MYGFFSRPTVRFLAGFLFACFFLMPVMLVMFGLPDSLWFFASAFIVVGIAGGVWWVRRPPAIFYQPPPGVHGAGVFNRPTARFLAGFLFACFVSVPVIWILRGPPSSLSFLAPMVGVGIVGGVMWVRRPPAFFTR